MKRNRILLTGLVSLLVVLAAVAGRAEIADSAPQAAPSNQTPPAVSGTPEEGKTLTTNNGTWAGTTPMTGRSDALVTASGLMTRSAPG